mmetsp:Transcript_166448/g.534736  ORF Transcript_166448/g.534736 Transcript_166448/m.534736 type:complete len:124 (+) Transcript_166448:219-590(+)
MTMLNFHTPTLEQEGAEPGFRSCLLSACKCAALYTAMLPYASAHGVAKPDRPCCLRPPLAWWPFVKWRIYGEAFKLHISIMDIIIMPRIIMRIRRCHIVGIVSTRVAPTNACTTVTGFTTDLL